MKTKVYVINVIVDGLDTKVVLKDEDLAHRFGFWLICNDYQFSYKVYPQGFDVGNADSSRAEWIFSEFLREDNFK